MIRNIIQPVTQMKTLCPCGSQIDLAKCCGRFIDSNECPDTPEQLMRSRFSAYFLKRYDYVLATYSAAKRNALTVAELENSDGDCQWLSLSIIARPSDNQVEFKAYYKIQQQFFVLHEKSDFIIEDQRWRYDSGVLYADSAEIQLKRNDPCLCNSGKKYKKCCL
ncbi:YchJ family protein [Aliiglaciecola sp. LCG003]|uniref:YchJ family protein n=1 Tax=Aliiglaciecola sp. LCG003 TaxID=3053655 RepID=UPI002572E898|nr:YchJ family protein [Aliiglaciecola sp. LCG003]WJG07709.1 YchJ family protein [Aliiglaciecola sp. LCG003]